MSGDLASRPYTAWQLLKAYWQSEQRTTAYTFFIGVLLLSLCIIGLDVTFTNWYNNFYNALQDYDKRSTIDLLIVFSFLAAIYIVFAVYRFYLQNFLGLRWRRWLTDQFLTRWMENKSYYYLENFDENTDNPDQRIQEDIASLVNSSLSLVIGILSAIVTFFSFIYILWNLSGHVQFTLIGHVFHIPGYLVWVAIIYALVGTFLTFKIGQPLINLNFEQQRREANFRFAAIDLRTHSENVALYHGEHHQKNVLQKIFYGALNNWYAIILRQKLLMWFTSGYNQVSVLVPLVVALPNYFNKVFKLGGLIQSLSAFQRIQDALSFLVNSYNAIAEWRAVMQRLLSFLNHVHESEQKAATHNHFSYYQNTENKIIIDNMMINTPKNDYLLKNINEEFTHGNHYLIKGDSGIGKSTLVRAIAGIWPYGSGNIFLPQQKKIMYLPQRSYMPLGTLREALLFPDNISHLPDSELIQLLHHCDLPLLTKELHHVTRWSEHLSPGELQRIAFVRVLIHAPDWIFLDESTSALDLRHEQQLYELLKKQLPHCSIVSVGHRPSLEKYHDKIIELEAYRAEQVADKE